jgi:trans-2,3-dihydro-3-hydroxyanthranilate isomerase
VGRTRIFDVFAAGPGGGNPCQVTVDADEMSTGEMLTAAWRYGHECAFLVKPTLPEADVRMRYFVPRHEMEMCVHATVAGVTALERRGTVRVQTPLGVLETTVDDEGVVTVQQFPPVLGSGGSADEVAKALGCRPERIRSSRSVSVSRAKLLVEIDGVETLNALRPDSDKIRQVCEDLDVTGLYPFALNGDVWARQFPRDSGYLEDPATGLAAAALGAHLALHEEGDGEYRYDVHQGQAMGRPSLMTAHATRTNGDVIRAAVTGRASAPQPRSGAGQERRGR